MSRFSPSVLPHAYAPDLPDFGNALARAFADNDARRRQDELERQRTESHNVDLYEHGVRRGTTPSDDVTITQPAPASFDPSIDWHDAFGTGRPRPGGLGGFVAEQPPLHAGHTAMDEDPRDYGLDTSAWRFPGIGGAAAAPAAAQQQGDPMIGALASAFGDPAKSAAVDGSSTPTSDDLSSRAPSAAVHPGAFDPATRQFGGAPSQQLTAAMHANGPAAGGPTSTTLRNTNPRYVDLGNGTYVDTFNTPVAERQRDRMAQLEASANYRQGDIALRGQQAVNLEDAKQKGRVQLRGMISDAAVSDIRLREALQGENQAAHDARARGTAVTVAGMRTGANGGRGTATSEVNHRYAADGVIRASGGDYKAAVDWLDNTPEGQAAKQGGLAAHHLYEAQGRYFGHVTDQGVRLEAGASAMSPGEAIGAVGETGQAVRGAVRPGSPDAQATEQRRDWDAAAAALRKQRKTQQQILQTLGPRP